ncbi:hypothetical protein CMUS01_15721 [Colletotrichum musicola]|uniref:Uncharacterized protein n=1 Tax=Colletotrichum musicola TaxID=2175873 RepID=A0A8H6IV34_9PEZI|nr:hypothetical protein CMUS01_15721 [Colletotrichum musicola]
MLGITRPDGNTQMQEPSKARKKTPSHPLVRSFLDLDSVSEIWDNETGEVSRTTFTLCTADDSVFQGGINNTNGGDWPAELDTALRYISSEDTFPPLRPSSLTSATSP